MNPGYGIGYISGQAALQYVISLNLLSIDGRLTSPGLCIWRTPLATSDNCHYVIQGCGCAGHIGYHATASAHPRSTHWRACSGVSLTS